MVSSRLYLYDTTLRDGAQTRGVDFSVCDKQKISSWLDDFGIDYIEGGWPGANPTDTAFFADLPRLTQSRFASFGMTHRANVTAEEDKSLQTILASDAPCVCLVGKTWDFHVISALGISLEENLDVIATSVLHALARGKEVLFDAEHFFDGFKANPEYALQCLKAALDAGARWIVLCDTNGGALPDEVSAVLSIVTMTVPGDKLGFHGHNDTGNAVANSLVAVRAGCAMVQGTLGGLGERCGNADLFTLIPTLVHKMHLDVGVADEKMHGLVGLSQAFDKLLDRNPDTHAPYVGGGGLCT